MKAWSTIKWYLFAYFFCFSFILIASELEFACPVIVSSHSAFLGKPVAQNAILELGMINYLRYHHECTENEGEDDECGGEIISACDENDTIAHPSWFIDFFPFFFVSTNMQKVAEYLFPNDNSSIVVADNNISDVSSPWIDITSPDQTFSSRLTIRPRRIEAGFAVSFFSNLYWLCTPETQWPERIWIEAFAPLEWVQHNLSSQELMSTTTTTTGTSFCTAISAFNNPSWEFGKLSPHPLNTFGFSDILLRLGFDALRSDHNHLAFYGCAFIATGDGLKSHYLFEPTLGNLGHTGLGGGINTDWFIWQNGDTTLVNWMIDLRAAYFFKRHETRSIDLVYNLDWSRYLQVASINNLAAPLPGINFFTQSLEIEPQSSVNLWTALHLKHCNSHFEIGYNFWWRQREIAHGFTLPQIVIYDIQGPPGELTSASTATIATGAPGIGAPTSDLEPILVIPSMLSENTPIIPNIYINSVYVSYGAQLMHHGHPILISAGIYYDASHHNSGFSGVGGWFKGSWNF